MLELDLVVYLVPNRMQDCNAVATWEVLGILLPSADVASIAMSVNLENVFLRWEDLITDVTQTFLTYKGFVLLEKSEKTLEREEKSGE